MSYEAREFNIQNLPQYPDRQATEMMVQEAWSPGFSRSSSQDVSTSKSLPDDFQIIDGSEYNVPPVDNIGNPSMPGQDDGIVTLVNRWAAGSADGITDLFRGVFFAWGSNGLDFALDTFNRSLELRSAGLSLERVIDKEAVNKLRSLLPEDFELGNDHIAFIRLVDSDGNPVGLTLSLVRPEVLQALKEGAENSEAGR